MRSDDRLKKRVRVTGLTLIELVVALVLAAMMMVGLLRIVSVIALETNQLRGERTDYVAAGALADRIRTDLINARGVNVTADSITLAGYLDASGLPSTVVYRKRLIGNRFVMARQSAGNVEWCWIGFGRFAFEPLVEADLATPPNSAAGGLPSVPSRFRLSALDDAGNLLFSEVIRHHAAS